MTPIKCTKCGKEVFKNATVCPYCGSPITPHPETNHPVIVSAASKGAKGGRLKTILIVIAVLFIMSFFISFTDKEDTDNNAVINSDQPELNEEYLESESASTDTTIPEIESETTASEKNNLEDKSEPASTETEEVPHRTNDEIVGVSDKSISDTTILFKDSVRNDITGNWRLSELAEIFEFNEYVLSYYHNYFSNDSEIHAIINYSTKTTTSVSVLGDRLDVCTYEYVEGEEKDANQLFTGLFLAEYHVYLDNGDIEKIQ